MTFGKKILIGAGLGVLGLGVLVAVVFANLTAVVRTVLEKEVPGLTFQELDVGWNSVSVTGVEVKRSGKRVFKVDALRVYPSLLSVFTDTIHISSIQIDGPYVYVVRNPDGSLALPTPDGMGSSSTGNKPKPKQKTEKPPEETAGRALAIDSVRIRNGKGDYLDKSVQGAPAKFTFTELDLEVQQIEIPSKDRRLEFEMTVKLEGKRTGKMEAEGWYHEKSRSAEVEFELVQLFLPHAEPYYRGKHTSASMSDGAFGIESKVVMKNGQYVAKNEVRLSELAFSKDGLFLGVPVGIVREHLEKEGKPLVVEMQLEGSLDDKSKVQQQIVAEVVKVLAKELGQKALTHAAEELKKGIGAEGEKALNSFFGK